MTTTNTTGSKPQADYYANTDFHTDFNDGNRTDTGDGSGFGGQPQAAVKKLTRPRNGRMLAGVCAGVANYLKVDPAIVRFAAIALAIFTAGTAALVYAAGWILMPEQETHDITTTM